MKTFDLILKTVEIKSENTVSNIILGTFYTIEEAQVSRANKVYEMRKDINAEIIYAMKDGSQMITDSENGYIFIIEEHKPTSLDEEMELWEARANDEFGQILKVIEMACADYFYAEPDEYGILTTPLSHYITAYSLDGNRKYTAKAIYSILENYDILEDDGAIVALANKMKRLAV